LGGGRREGEGAGPGVISRRPELGVHQTDLMVYPTIIGRDIVCIEKDAFLKPLEAVHGRRYFNAAGEESRE
jgi:hypothetical protein